MKPLGPLSSIKTKLGVVILAAVGVTFVVQVVGIRAELPLILVAIGSGTFALVIIRLLARGMTSPLRAMAAAAKAMAAGDYSQRVTATSRDEVGELARAFNAMADELASVDRVRRDLIANVSHELRTPISALHAQLENWIDGVEEPDPDLASGMLMQVQRLESLVAQLLDLSKLESGVIPIRLRPVHLKELVDRAVDEGLVANPGVQVEVQIEPADLIIRADPERLHQVIANLLANAAHFSPAGGKVEVLARTVRDEVSIEVIDQGPGIPPGERSRVFERFYRADEARSSSDGGAGLGLAIARWIVDLHGGDIRADAATTGGCRMVVRLPATA